MCSICFFFQMRRALLAFGPAFAWVRVRARQGWAVQPDDLQLRFAQALLNCMQHVCHTPSPRAQTPITEGMIPPKPTQNGRRPQQHRLRGVPWRALQLWVRTWGTLGTHTEHSVCPQPNSTERERASAEAPSCSASRIRRRCRKHLAEAYALGGPMKDRLWRCHTPMVLARRRRGAHDRADGTGACRGRATAVGCRAATCCSCRTSRGPAHACPVCTSIGGST